MTFTTRRTVITTGALASLGVLVACGSDSDPLDDTSTSDADAGGGGGDIVIGSANFSESVLLAEVYAAALNGAGVSASTKTNIGSREIYLKALEQGEVDVVPEYTGALALYYDPEFDEREPDAVYSGLEGLLPESLVILEKSAAENNDSINVTKETADANSLTTLEDLAAVADGFALAAPPEFKERPQGIPGLEKTYGITFESFRPLAAGQAITQALRNDQVQAANIFSTDPSITENGFVTLEDTKKLFGSQNIVPLVRSEDADAVRATLDAVSAALTTEVIAGLLKQTDVDKADPKAVAEEFVSGANLG